ncbi:MAG: thioredoxin family protein [Betaproteobacteria bacterium]|nr:thioredoxin family protein [Betaproteobacteria bacterium]
MSPTRLLPRIAGAALAALSFLAFAAPAAHAAPVRTERVEAELHAEKAAAVAGKPATVGLRLKHDEHWHTYWKNPGDSGLPTKIRWTLPEGWTAGAFQWPHPERLPFGPLVNYGYSGETMLLAELTPPANAKPGPVTIAGDADWLVCNDVCIPEKASLKLEFAVAEGDPAPKSGEVARFAKARASLPAKAEGWKAESTMAGGQLTVRLMPPEGAVAPGKAFFFPDRESFIEPAAPQALARDGGGFRLAVKLAQPEIKDVTTVSGVIVTEGAWPGLPGRKAVEIAAPLVTSFPAPAAALPVPDAPAPAGAEGSLLAALAFAFLGGILLNLMPCVFPVLGIKVMGFVRHAHGDARALWMQGVVFSAGVLVSFLVLAGLLLALRAGGAQLGWGFQLQSPAFVMLLAALFFLMGLNLFGVFEWGGFAQSMTSNVSAQGRYADAFLAGVLATVVATPCTAPFMGAAVGFTLAQPAAVSLAVFAMLGVGMAAPVLLLSLFPNALKRLPKPGVWMETFKQVMAFPLFATVVWLAWVLGAQAGNDAVMMLLAGLLLLALAAWIYGRWARSESLLRFVFAAAFAATGLWLAWPHGATAPGAAQASAPRAGEVPWQAWSPEKLAQLRAAGIPVFVDFTAAWCVTCQVNKRVALNREEVVKAFSDRGVVALKADWTNHDPRITAALAELGRNALPVYAVYAPGATQPKLLPEVLTASIVVDELSRLPAPKQAALPAPPKN